MHARALRLVLLVVFSLLAGVLAACGSEKSSPKPAAQSPSSSSSLSLTELRACLEANSGKRTSIVLTEREDEQMRYTDDLGGAAPDDVVRRALAAGGWLRLTYEPEDFRGVVIVGGMDVLDFGNATAAQAGKTAALAGTNEDGEPVSKFSQAVQVENLVFVYEKTYDDDGSGTRPGVIGSTRECLGKLGSTATLPDPRRIETQPVE